SDNIAVRTDTTLIAYGNVANVPIEVATEDNSLVDVSLTSRKVTPRFTSESSGLVEIPVTVSTGPVVPANSTSKKPKRKGKTSLASSNSKLTPRSSKQTVMGSKSSSPMSPASVSKRRRVMEEPSMLLQDENAGETRRRSLRNRGEIRKPVIETDEDEYLLSDEDDAHDNLDVDDDNDYAGGVDVRLLRLWRLTDVKKAGEEKTHYQLRVFCRVYTFRFHRKALYFGFSHFHFISLKLLKTYLSESKTNQLFCRIQRRKEGRGHTTTIVNGIRETVKEYNCVHVFSFKNMKNIKFKEFIQQFRHHGR
ncbi:hypothetical protein DY000_02053414, partial [Brassica cretica]